MSRKALILGGAGFIGVHLARQMVEAGWRIHIADNFFRGQRDCELEEICRSHQVQFSECDLMNEEALALLGDDHDVIIHLAARLGVQAVMRDPGGVLWENVALLRNALMVAMAQRNLCRFVFSSSSEVMGAATEQGAAPIPTPESASILMPSLDQPRSAYMISKICGENMCLTSGLPVTILRPHNIFGPRMGEDHVVPQLMRKCWSAEPGDSIEVFSPEHTRTFCYVADAADMIRALLDTEIAIGSVYNVGNDFPEVTIRHLAKRLIAMSGKELVIKDMPIHAGSQLRRCPDISRARSDIGFEPQVSLDQGLRATQDWYVSHWSQSEATQKHVQK